MCILYDEEGMGKGGAKYEEGVGGFLELPTRKSDMFLIINYVTYVLLCTISMYTLLITEQLNTQYILWVFLSPLVLSLL